MTDEPAPDYWKQRYGELARAVTMVSIAFEESFGEGIGAVDTPLHECEMIARAIYRQKRAK